MASERAKADEENLRQTAFEKGEWANQPPTDLDVDYDLLSGALGTAGSPLMSITAETLLALPVVLCRPPAFGDAGPARSSDRHSMSLK